MTEEHYDYRTSQALLRYQFPGKGKLQIPIIIYVDYERSSWIVHEL